MDRVPERDTTVQTINEIEDGGVDRSASHQKTRQETI